jgi:hypothetical protein
MSQHAWRGPRALHPELVGALEANKFGEDPLVPTCLIVRVVHADIQAESKALGFPSNEAMGRKQLVDGGRGALGQVLKSVAEQLGAQHVLPKNCSPFGVGATGGCIEQRSLTQSGFDGGVAVSAWDILYDVAHPLRLSGV